MTAEPHLVIDRPHALVHAIRIDPDSELRRILGADEVRVNSLHHQAVDRVGDDLRAVAWAEDGTIEAVEDRRARIIGVQWHPEQLADQAKQHRLFSWLVDQARLRLTPQGQAR